MNEYFQAGAVPAPNSPGSSAVMRQEFNNIAGAFDKLPILGGHAGEIVVVDPTGTALVTTGSSIGDYVTKDGVFTLTNKTIAWASNTFPGFGSGATKDAGVLAGNVLLLQENNTLPALDAGNLTNIPGLALKANANNAVLTGAPVCPTPPIGDNGARIANTQFVTETLQAIGSFAPSNSTPLMDGVGAPGTSPLGSRGDHVHPSDTSRAPASAATAAGTSFTPAGTIGATDVQLALQELDTEKAPLASPAFTGNPTAPTPSNGDNDTSIATTAFVQSAIASLASLASPAFTGNPTAPTPLTSDNDTSIATTAFVQTLVAQQPFGMQPSNVTPFMDGVATPGTGVEGSRYDHVHPVDTSRAPASAGTATGTSFTPSGNIAATNVQAAIQELDTETQAGLATKQPLIPFIGFNGALASSGLGTSGPISMSVVRNDGGFFDGAKFQPTVAGWYAITASGVFNVPAGGTFMGLTVVKNGSETRQFKQIQAPYATNFAQVSVTAVVYLNGTNDNVTFAYAAGLTGGTLTSYEASGALLQKAP